MRVTKTAVDGLCAGPKDIFLWDSELRGFGLKVTPSGTKTYVLQYRMGGRGSPTQRFTIGRHGSPWTPAEARREAERLLMQSRLGTSPRAAAIERQRQDIDLAVSQYSQKFMEEYGRRHWRTSTRANVKSYFNRWVIPVVGRKSIALLHRRDIAAIFDRIPSENGAVPRNVFAFIRKMMAWAVERGDIDLNPLAGLKSPPSVPSRERVLDEDELGHVWEATHQLGYPFGTIIRLLILTGQRRDEVARMRWSELSRKTEEWALPPERTKNARSHTVPLSSVFVAELDAIAGQAWPRDGYVFTTNGYSPFSGFSKMKAKLVELTPAVIEPWRIHDLRRTLATGFQRLAVRFEVTEAVLNHVSGARSGVAGVYQRHDWKDEKRQALETWAARVSDLRSIT